MSNSTDINTTEIGSEIQQFETALWLNSVIAVVALTLFCYLRAKKPDTYAPRVARGSAVKLSESWFSWLTVVLKVSEDAVFESAGLDALMMLKYLKMAMQLFFTLMVIGLVVLMPVNVHGGNEMADFDLLSVSNVTNGSNLLWFHSIGVWIISLFVYYFLYKLYEDYVMYRHKYLSLPAPKQYSILVEALPENLQDDENIARYFMELYNKSVFSVSLVKDTTHLDELLARRNEIADQLAHALGYYLKNEDRASVGKLTSLCGCCKDAPLLRLKSYSEEVADREEFLAASPDENTDAIEYWGFMIAALNEEINEIKLAGFSNTETAIVTFSSLQVASMYSQVIHIANPGQMLVTPAPEPNEIYVPNLLVSDYVKMTRRLIVNTIIFWTVFFFSVPTTFISSIGNLDQLATQATFLRSFVGSLSPGGKSFIQGYLPPILLSVLMSLLPGFLAGMARFQGLISESKVKTTAMEYYFLFQIVNVYFITLISGSILGSIDGIISNPTSVVDLLASSVPKVSSFFINYVMLQALSGFTFEILQLGPLIVSNLKLRFCLTEKEKTAVTSPGEIQYFVSYCDYILTFVISLTYCTISPLILPFSFLYFAIGYVVMKYQVLYVYIAEYESGGKFWPLVFSRSVIGLVVCQITVFGVLGLKGAAIPAAILIPLPFMTLYFWWYTVEKFLPVADALPVEKAIRCEIPPSSPDYSLKFLKSAYDQEAVVAEPLDISLDLLFPKLSEKDLSTAFGKEKTQQYSNDKETMGLASEAIKDLKSLLNVEMKCKELKSEKFHSTLKIDDLSENPTSNPIVLELPSPEAITKLEEVTIHDDSTEISKKVEENLPVLGFHATLPSDYPNSMELIHAQGLQCSPLTFEFVRDPEDVSLRPYYCMPFGELIGAPSHENTLCCRKKSNEDKYRFVLGTNITKKGNPNYIGKLTKSSASTYIVTLESGVQLAEIKFVQMLSKTAVTVKIVEMLNQYTNVQEVGSGGSCFSGVFVHSKLSSLVLSLSTESANRSVLEIYNSYQFDKQNVDKSKTPNCMDSNNSRYYVDFDYPYSIFLAFATLCAVEAYQQA